MRKIKAIPTRYKGFSFRSRLEARWAAFLDALEIKWDYEPEGFQLPKTGRYLPDFLIEREKEDFDFWLEIKGKAPTQRDIARGLELSVLDRPVFIFSGSFSRAEDIFILLCLNGKCLDTRKIQRDEPLRKYADWPEFLLCDRPSICDIDRLLLLVKDYSSSSFKKYCTNYYLGMFCSDAVVAARSARFEFLKAA